MDGKYASEGLPSVVQHYNPEEKNQNITVCEGDSVFLFTDYFSDVNYEWTGPLGFTSSLQDPVIANPKPEMSGIYYCNIRRDGSIIYRDSSIVTVNPKEKILFADIIELNTCYKTYDLKALENPQGQIITWQGINSKDNIVTITQDGKYRVIVENQFGCIDSAEINIKFIPAYCEGDTIFLSSGKIKNVNNYLWSGPNGFSSTEDNQIIPNSKVNMTGEYSVRIISINSFSGKIDTIYKKISYCCKSKSKNFVFRY